MKTSRQLCDDAILTLRSGKGNIPSAPAHRQKFKIAHGHFFRLLFLLITGVQAHGKERQQSHSSR
jgi:hypothetical protein